jgi:glucosyl-3-phosphoglycerate synthase
MTGTIRTYNVDEAVIAKARARKGDRTVGVCIPARNEAPTVGAIVAEVAKLQIGDRPMVDRLIVFDDGSQDLTAAISRNSGAEVVSVKDVAPQCGPGQGKGNVLWASIVHCETDIIVWIDADLTLFDASFVERLVAPLLIDDSVDLVKGFYRRQESDDGRGGGRTTELVARPLLSLFFPDLAHVRQPLGGECAARRELLKRIPIVQGYGVESGLLVDTANLVGSERIGQVDLGERRHRHRPLAELAVQAAEIQQVLLKRAGVDLPNKADDYLISPEGEPRVVTTAERPPAITVAGEH